MSKERGEKDPLDIIRWMGKISSEGDVFRVGLEITGGPDKGKFVEIIAPTYNYPGSNRFVIFPPRVNKETAKEIIPILAEYIPSGLASGEISMDTVAKRLRKTRRDKGTKRTSLGHL